MPPATKDPGQKALEDLERTREEGVLVGEEFQTSPQLNRELSNRASGPRDPMAFEVRGGQLVPTADASNRRSSSELTGIPISVGTPGITKTRSGGGIARSEVFDPVEVGFTVENGRITDVPEGGGFFEEASGRKTFLLPGGRIVDETGKSVVDTSSTAQSKRTDPFASIGSPQNAREELIAREALNTRNKKIEEINIATGKARRDVRAVRNRQSKMRQNAKQLMQTADDARTMARRLEGTRNRNDAIRATKLKKFAETQENEARNLLSVQDEANERIKNIAGDTRRLEATKSEVGKEVIQEAVLEIKVERERAAGSPNKLVSEQEKLLKAQSSKASTALGRTISTFNRIETKRGKTRKGGRQLLAVSNPDDPSRIQIRDATTGQEIDVNALIQSGESGREVKEVQAIQRRAIELKRINTRLDNIRIQQLGAPPIGLEFEDWMQLVKDVRDTHNITELEAISVIRDRAETLQ